MRIKIYVEGGGESNKLRTECRQGFRSFFEKSGLTGKMPAVVACGTRSDAFDSFCTAVAQTSQKSLPLLLVDSEAPLTQAPWAHLKVRDGWDRPATTSDEDVYLMVECMESWFLADPECLQKYFGQGFNRKSLPRSSSVEQISKSEVFKSLKMATRHSQSKGEYGKGKHSFEILGHVDPDKVRQVAPNAERLLNKLATNSSS